MVVLVEWGAIAGTGALVLVFGGALVAAAVYGFRKDKREHAASARATSRMNVDFTVALATRSEPPTAAELKDMLRLSAHNAGFDPDEWLRANIRHYDDPVAIWKGAKERATTIPEVAERMDHLRFDHALEAWELETLSVLASMDTPPSPDTLYRMWRFFAHDVGLDQIFKEADAYLDFIVGLREKSEEPEARWHEAKTLAASDPVVAARVRDGSAQARWEAQRGAGS